MKPTFVWEIQQRVKKTILKYEMIPPDTRVLLAVSGGPDSMVLTHIVSELMDEMGFQTRLCHVNHNLRGKESMEDEQFVVQQTKPYVLPLTVRRFNWDEVEDVKQGNLEENARKLRYAKLIHTSIEFDCTPILTGHTRSDQAETVLHRMIRSTGISGLGGIQPVRRDMEIPIARPLLDITRDEVLQYAKEAGLTYRQDSMNEDLQYTRVRIRQSLLPILRDEFNPNIEDALANLANVARDEEQFWQFRLLDLISNLGEGNQVSPADRMIFLDYHPAEQRRIIREYARRISLDISSKQIEDVMEQLKHSTPQSEIQLNQGFRFFRRYDEFFIAKPSEKVQPVLEHRLQIPGTTKIDELNIEIFAEISPVNVVPLDRQDESIGSFDADRITDPVIVRTRLEGDAIVPLGMKGRKKVKKILQEHRVPQEQRDRVPIICMNDEIVWVGGYCVSEKYRVTGETEKVLQMRIERI